MNRSETRPVEVEFEEAVEQILTFEVPPRQVKKRKRKKEEDKGAE